MVALNVRQASFSGGAMSADYWGRTDLQRYAKSLRLCRNWIPTPNGALKNRCGFQFVSLAALPDANEDPRAARHPRLVPFVYSEVQSYVIEVAADQLRFYSYGAPVESSPGVRFSIATGGVLTGSGFPYTARLKWVQVGDVMKFASTASAGVNGLGQIGLWELTRTSGTTFSLVIRPYAAKPYYWNAAHEPAINNATIYTADADHAEREWYYLVTQLLSDSVTGATWETSSFRVTERYATLLTTRSALPAANKLVVYPDKSVLLAWDGAPPLPANVKLVGFRIYKGRGTAVGNIGETSGPTFADFGYEPNYEDAPPEGRSPLDVYSDGLEGRATGTIISNLLPRAIAIFENRLVLANFTATASPTKDRPSSIIFSSTGDYNNYDRKDVPLDDTAIDIDLAARKREEIYWLVGVGPALLAGTSASAWAISGGGAPITPMNIAARVQNETGSLDVDPVIAHDYLLYARAKGSGIQSLLFANTQQGYGSEDVSVYFKRRFRDRTVVDLAWCKDPDSILWVLLDGGELLSLTFQPETHATAWAEHTVDGFVASICSVPEGQEDVLYACIRRTSSIGHVWTIERMLGRKAGIYLDSATVFSGAPTTVFHGFGRLEGKTVNALVDGNVVTGLTVASGDVTLPYPGSNVTIGLPVIADAELLDEEKARTRVKVVRKAMVEVVETRGVKVGETFDDMQQWQQRTVEIGGAVIPIEDETVELDIRSAWNIGGRACIRQDEPLPCTIVGVTRVLEVGGD